MGENLPVVLARQERVGATGWLGCGPYHVVNGKEPTDADGRVGAWCGARIRVGQLHVLQDRSGSAPHGSLYADLCRRCFNEPRRKKGGADSE